MVLITGIYVIATIAICSANFKSAKATREQIEESRRQFEEEHRACITYEFIYENRTWYGLRFTNRGKRIAQHVKIVLKEEFINSLTNPQFTKSLKALSGKEFLLGVDQSYDIYFGASEFLRNANKLPIQGSIVYSDIASDYEEHFCIDVGSYPPIFSVESNEEKYIEAVKNQTKVLDKLQHEIFMLMNYLKQENDNA